MRTGKVEEDMNAIGYIRVSTKPQAEKSGLWRQEECIKEYAKENGKWKFSVLKMRRPWPEFLGDIPKS